MCRNGKIKRRKENLAGDEMEGGDKINSRNLNFCSIFLKTGIELKPNTNVWMPMECRSN